MRSAKRPMHRVFVYGTLRPGERNSHYLDAAIHLGGHTTASRFILYDTGTYPAACDCGATALVGDVFAIDNETFAALDVLEAYPVHYTRRLIDTVFGAAWIYLWIAAVAPGWPIIAHGNWCRYRYEHGPSACRF